MSPHRALTIGLVVGTGGVALAGAVAYSVRRGRRLDDHPLPDGPLPALVLGCRPGPALSARVAAAVGMWRAGFATRIIVSGAFGEAEAGVAFARGAGVPPDRVVAETEARSTFDNLRHGAALAGGPMWVVSDRLHVPRAMEFAAGLDIAVYPWPVDRPRKSPRAGVRAVVQEGLSVLYGRVQGR